VLRPLAPSITQAQDFTRRFVMLGMSGLKCDQERDAGSRHIVDQAGCSRPRMGQFCGVLAVTLRKKA
jgi:hypothetical protein